ncbi:S9 family peptidase [Haliscomenobacter hydrossis]|uniref:Peptidase S9, prolyl oligopeptidase active site region:peptidase S9B, dipeptidylpeptidase IV n=1 Tax=Haliscomenobacter hydrossis (strain ATCC 27775 / DSM 1100 / LMG 10767 / O) TaxID=760192 RepID=F4L057_HALH1|nr:prolyl oligopeptidase family serine peptidase [Haliscomenobacter hydrossis]AEE52766.1 peptidase S9, prolyl oligopeptidase active site region:peptidase S9B, dipeptidylpeptidase IV [Haliscomenobacter hydrossis DSM 1100]
MLKKLLVLIVFFSMFTTAYAQPITKADYQRAVSFLWSNLSNKVVFNDNIQPIWAQDSSGVAFVQQHKSGKTYHKVSRQSKKIEPWFDQDRLAKALAEAAKTEVNAQDLPIQNLRYKDAQHLGFNHRGTAYELDLNTYTLTDVTRPFFNPLQSKSPDGKWIAYTENYNLYIKSTADASIVQLSENGERFYEYGTSYGWSDIIEGENGERPQRLSVRWSPDSKWIQTYITDMRVAKKMYLLDWSQDDLYKPKLLSYYRGSPGDTDMVRMIPVFYNIKTGEEYVKAHLQSTHTNPIQYEWSKTSGVVYQENAIRGYQAVELHRCDLNKKSEELLYRETSATNIDNYNSEIIEEWGKVLITSERDGWKQLYLLDLKDKSLQALTKGAYFINQVLHIDIPKRFILFSASGKEAGRNPYYQHLYKLTLATGKVELLTPENANHDVSVSPDGGFFTDNISTLNQPTRTLLKEASPKALNLELLKADVRGLDSLGCKLPEPFTAIGRDGKTTIYGAIWKPSKFDPGKKYPIIDQSYTGPHTNMFPRNFSSAMSRSNQALAELGFIVITVDGLGTAGRSKAFHNVSYKNMGKNLEDHRLAILQLGRKNAWMDTTRVGIFGHSAGGYDAGHAVLEYPDFYKVAVASSADHDFRMEKDWWPEMYMGWPVDSTYHQVSNITMAGNLKGKLLITHGGIDENVNPSATFKLAEALIRANKEFDMLILPSQKHGYQGIYNDYFTKKRWNYFVEHLLGVEPIWEFELR